MEEIWKDIPGYEGLYQASNLRVSGWAKPSSSFSFAKALSTVAILQRCPVIARRKRKSKLLRFFS
jgi:hypothetical protein